MQIDPTTSTKTCTQCNATLPLSAFGIYRRRADGLNRRCRACERQVSMERRRAQGVRPRQANLRLREDVEARRAYYRQWMARRREAWFRENGPCRRCGTWERLELDHIDRTTKISHAVWSWSDERRNAELAKCQPLCHDCHIQKGLEAGDIVRTQHGSEQMYSFYDCRCDLCRQRQSTRKKARRAQRERQPGL
jgi:hypothetical protein